MKKIFILIGILLATIATIASCGSVEVSDEVTEVNPKDFSNFAEYANSVRHETIELQLVGDTDRLLDEVLGAYRAGTYDGNTYIENDHIVSVDEEGTVWLDNKEYVNVNYNPHHIGRQVSKCIYHNNKGSYLLTYNGVIELWKSGEMFVEYANKLFDTSTTFYPMSDNYICTVYGSEMGVLNLLTGEWRLLSDQVIDVYQDEDNNIIYSDFEKKINKISGTNPSETEEIGSNIVRFNKAQATFKLPDMFLLDVYEICKKSLQDEEWDGNFTNICNLDSTVSGNIYVSIDSFNRLIINNRNTGVFMTTEEHPFAVKKEGANVLNYLGEIFLIAEHGKFTIYQKNVPDAITTQIPNADAYEILWTTPRYYSNLHNKLYRCDTAIAAYNADGTRRVFVVHQNFKENTNQVLVYAPDAIDAYVAYDTLYYMEQGGAVMVVHDWQNSDSDEELFVKKAYALSHFCDEAEGAIVPEELANYYGYGYNNLFSPYGK